METSMMGSLVENRDMNRHVTSPLGNELVGPGAAGASAVPDPQIVERAKWRRFSAAYKLSIVEQAAACRDRGEVGSLLRREGLYHSTLASFRQQHAAGLLAPGAAGRKRASKDPLAAALVAQKSELERELRQLRRQLARAEEIITIQKKASALLGETLADLQIGNGEL